MQGADPGMSQSACIAPDASTGARDTRWLVLLIACLGVLMDSLDGTVVNIALPAIRTDLGFPDNSLVWVTNAYLMTFGGFLLLGGRLGDHFGYLRMILSGIALFAVASLLCGIANTWWLLIIGRAIQGLGAAAVLATSLPVILRQFPAKQDRARALAIYSCMLAIAGSAGVCLGGVLTDTLGWRWIFFINLVLSAIVQLIRRLLDNPIDHGRKKDPLDIAGAVTVTTSLTLATFAVLNATRAGWWSTDTLLALCGALVSGALFIAIEARARDPLISLTLFAHPNLPVSVVAGALQNAGQCIWFFIAALQLQRVLGYSAGGAGLAFLPATLVMAALALGLSAKLVVRFGARSTLTVSLLLNAAGLVLLATVPVGAGFAKEILPGMLLVGLGAGLSYNPLSLSAMRGVRESDYGVASGVMSSCTVMAGALALAGAASLAATQTQRLLATRTAEAQALNSGYQLALALAAGCVAAAALVSLRIRDR